ncbi:putative plant specific eukaryotic initiation factor 4B [Helianthus annuus]|nr:putative plant specific eukaryotic initiation factor 4B [Helianthus annuus]
MAATVTSAWAKPGAWALDSEQHEDELNQPPPAPTPAPPTSDFPDLMTAAATKTKKKKAQTLSLGQFVSSSSNQTYQTPKGLTAEDLLNLPTGPRQRTAEELAGTRLGGGFRSYGDRNNESSNSRWGSGRGSGGGDEEGRRSSREPLGPSRADEIDDRFKRGGGKPRSVEDLSEKSWRKNQAVDADVAPPSGENNENGGHTEESEPKPEEDAQK